MIIMYVCYMIMWFKNFRIEMLAPVWGAPQKGKKANLVAKLVSIEIHDDESLIMCIAHDGIWSRIFCNCHRTPIQFGKEVWSNTIRKELLCCLDTHATPPQPPGSLCNSSSTHVSVSKMSHIRIKLKMPHNFQKKPYKVYRQLCTCVHNF